MIEVDTFSLVLLVLAAGTMIYMAHTAMRWRGMMKADLPFWGFARAKGLDTEQLSARALQIAEMRCATCSSQEECAQRIAAGERSPAADCPNEPLLKSR